MTFTKDYKRQTFYIIMGNKPNTYNLSQTQYQIETKQQVSAVEELKYLTSSPSWSVDFKEYTANRWKKILPLIKKTDIVNIIFQEISNPDVLSSFIHIDFHLLQRIELNNVHLYSLQKIAFLNAPQLKNLQFSANRIVSIRPLRKLHAPNLKSLELYENCIQESDKLSECNFGSEMDRIVMFSAIHMKVPQNYNWLVKMKMQKLCLFEYYSRRVINNSQMKNMVKNRFPELQLALRYDRRQ